MSHLTLPTFTNNHLAENKAPASAINKKAISDSFSNSAESYDSGAQLQRKVGHQLLQSIKPVNCLLDLGTGPGYFTHALVNKTKQLVGVDIAPNMLHFAKDRNSKLNDKNKVVWLAGDAEQLPLTDNCINGIFSSLMLQWVHQLPKALREAYRVLNVDGELSFSTLLDGTLFELAKAWKNVDGLQHVNSFLTYDVLLKIINDSDFELVSLTTQSEIIYYDSVIALMRDLKAIGANQTANGSTGLMGRGALKKLTQGYEPFRTVKGLSTTYQVAFCTLRKSTTFTK